LPEWLVERGLGETRAALIHGGAIIEARIELEDVSRAGSIVAARLVSGGRNAIARDDQGAEYILPGGAPGVTEGAEFSIEITREAVPGCEPWKRPRARMTSEERRPAPLLAERIGGRELIFPAPRDELADVGWNELIDEARSGLVSFPGGELRVSPTPAMTLIDVDGHLEPEDLAIRGSTEAGRAIRRLDIGGSIGIDLPTTNGKAARKSAGDAIDEHLPQPFERTAINGFGFVQIVRPRARPSLIELALDGASFEARALMRRAARGSPGAKRLVAHPAVVRLLHDRPAWIDALSRHVGGPIGLRPDPALPMSGGYAEVA
jgi:ribonuclease G